MYDAMHGMVRRLRPIALDRLGLRDALRELVSAQNQLHPKLSIDLRLEGDLDGLGEAINITSYRTVQECLTNIVRHADATRAEVFVRHLNGTGEDSLQVIVRDNGKGMTGGRPLEEHYGLLGVRERVQALGGKCKLVTEAGNGLSVEVSLPLPASARVAA